MVRIEILVGTIASGKSTYCRARAKDGAIIINDDAIVTALHGGQYDLYDKTIKPLYKAVELSILMSAICLGRDVVIDRPNLTKLSRAKYIAPAKAMECYVEIILFEFKDARVHALRRAADDTRGYNFGYWERVAQVHIDQYEPPEVDEGYDSIIKM